MIKIMIIRHAEKPSTDGGYRGVSILGSHDKHDLSVRGWQRAGALVRYFAPIYGEPPFPIESPRAIFASAPTSVSPSLRAKHTVVPLAEALGLAVHAPFADGEEARLAPALLAADGPVLVCWHHHSIPDMVRIIAGDVPGCPDHWPDDRFDLVWILERGFDGAWRFSQVVQRLLAYDIAEPAVGLMQAPVGKLAPDTEPFASD